MSRIKQIQHWEHSYRHYLVYLGAFLIPIIIMGSYFAYRRLAPFGSGTVMTIDLGQQYVDFLAYLRTCLLHHPSGLWYSFAKGLGGETWSTASYYLLSPLNLIILFFKPLAITSAIAIITLLRYGLAGLTMAYLLQSNKIQTSYRIWIFTIPYALNGWMIANQFNVIWGDVLWLLPLVINGLLKLVQTGHWQSYVFWLAFLMIDSYYMAWMVCLFTCLIFMWLLCQPQTVSRWQLLGRFTLSSLTSALISMIVLLPTVISLLSTKGTYTETSIKWKFEYYPWKLLNKLVPGSFNFSQIPAGQANFYVGMLMLCGAILYFTCRQFSWKERSCALVITLFLLASPMVGPLDLLWHLGQFPVWYPARFAFVISFWLIWLAALTFQPNRRWSLSQIIILITTLVIFSVAIKLQKVKYVKNNQELIGLLLLIITVVLVVLPIKEQLWKYTTVLILLVCVDMGINMGLSLNNISYVSQSQFSYYNQDLFKNIRKIKQHDSKNDYRIAKTYLRTKVEPMQADFNGGDHFNSMMEPALTHFMGNIGQPVGDGFITYSNGTKITDDLLGFKYLMNKQDSNHSTKIMRSGYRPDWTGQPIITQDSKTIVHQNTSALPLAFSVNQQILQAKISSLNPLKNQEAMINAMTGKQRQLFTRVPFTQVVTTNVRPLKKTSSVANRPYGRLDVHQIASVELKLVPKSNDPYYVIIGPAIKDLFSVDMNNRTFGQTLNYRNDIVLNVASHQINQPIWLNFNLKKKAGWLQDVAAYRLHMKAWHQSQQELHQEPMHIQHFSNTKIIGTANIKKPKQVLMTTIPYNKGWHVQVDGHPVKPKRVVDTFMAIPMSHGQHRISMTYCPPLWKAGAVISLLALISTCAISFVQSKRK